MLKIFITNNTLKHRNQILERNRKGNTPQIWPTTMLDFSALATWATTGKCEIERWLPAVASPTFRWAVAHLAALWLWPRAAQALQAGRYGNRYLSNRTMKQFSVCKLPVWVYNIFIPFGTAISSRKNWPKLRRWGSTRLISWLTRKP